MSNIGGERRQGLPEFTKKVGLFEAKVIAINPDMEEYKEVLGIELKDDSKALEYLGKSQDGNTTLRVDVWLEEIKNNEKFKVTFFLEDKERGNKDGTKQQYINNIGICAWAADENTLPEWFSKRDYRKAYSGEEELYNFLRIWLSELDYAKASTVLELDWKKMMKGNVKDLRDQIDGEWCGTFVALATIKTVIKEDETKEYQAIYNKAFLPTFALKQFRLIDYSNESVLTTLRNKKPKDLKVHERFVLNVAGEYGCRDYYILKDLKEYNADDNLVASNEVISDDGGDY